MSKKLLEIYNDTLKNPISDELSDELKMEIIAAWERLTPQLEKIRVSEAEIEEIQAEFLAVITGTEKDRERVLNFLALESLLLQGLNLKVLRSSESSLDILNVLLAIGKQRRSSQ